MSVGSIPTFFDDGSMYMRLRCFRCKVSNKICINVLLEKKTPPVCGKCKKNLIEQEDVDEIVASIHPDELKPGPLPEVVAPDPTAVEIPVEDEEDDWII